MSNTHTSFTLYSLRQLSSSYSHLTHISTSRYSNSPQCLSKLRCATPSGVALTSACPIKATSLPAQTLKGGALPLRLCKYTSILALPRCLAKSLLIHSSQSSSPPSVSGSGSLLPSSANRISSNSNHLLSPSDMVGPSPVTSNGTEATEIEDDVADDMMSPQDGDPTQHSEVRQVKGFATLFHVY